MKVIRKIQPVVVCDEDAEKNKEFTLDVFDSEPGYYKNVIFPMLAPGHEVELISWLKMVGLIPQMQTCNNAALNENCKRPMFWSPSKRSDNFIWKCKGCRKTKGIRANSVFDDIRCPFKDAIRAILGWCKGKDIETMTKMLKVRKQAVTTAFNTCTRIATNYIESHKSEWQIGGPGAVVIVDVYPEGCAKLKGDPSLLHGRYTPILCLAEAKEIPTKYWFCMLNQYHTEEQVCKANDTVIQTVKEIVLPGSVLVCDLHSRVASYPVLQALNHLYPVIVSTEGLSQHDSDDAQISTNLETIWTPAYDICEEAQTYPMSWVQNFLINQLWRHRFGSEAFEVLINQLYG